MPDKFTWSLLNGTGVLTPRDETHQAVYRAGNPNYDETVRAQCEVVRTNGGTLTGYGVGSAALTVKSATVSVVVSASPQFNVMPGASVRLQAQVFASNTEGSPSFEWKTSAGTVSGTGSSVTLIAPGTYSDLVTVTCTVAYSNASGTGVASVNMVPGPYTGNLVGSVDIDPRLDVDVTGLPIGAPIGEFFIVGSASARATPQTGYTANVFTKVSSLTGFSTGTIRVNTPIPGTATTTGDDPTGWSNTEEVYAEMFNLRNPGPAELSVPWEAETFGTLFRQRQGPGGATNEYAGPLPGSGFRRTGSLRVRFTVR